MSTLAAPLRRSFKIKKYAPLTPTKRSLKAEDFLLNVAGCMRTFSAFFVLALICTLPTIASNLNAMNDIVYTPMYEGATSISNTIIGFTVTFMNTVITTGSWVLITAGVGGFMTDLIYLSLPGIFDIIDEFARSNIGTDLRGRGATAYMLFILALVSPNFKALSSFHNVPPGGAPSLVKWLAPGLMKAAGIVMVGAAMYQGLARDYIANFSSFGLYFAEKFVAKDLIVRYEEMTQRAKSYKFNEFTANNSPLSKNRLAIASAAYREASSKYDEFKKNQDYADKLGQAISKDVFALPEAQLSTNILHSVDAFVTNDMKVATNIGLNQKNLLTQAGISVNGKPIYIVVSFKVEEATAQDDNIGTALGSYETTSFANYPKAEVATWAGTPVTGTCTLKSSVSYKFNTSLNPATKVTVTIMAAGESKGFAINGVKLGSIITVGNGKSVSIDLRKMQTDSGNATATMLPQIGIYMNQVEGVNIQVSGLIVDTDGTDIPNAKGLIFAK